MSFLNQIKANEPTATLEGYFISFLAKSKFGKTTFAIDLAREFYKGDMSKMLLLASEIGYRAMNGVYAIPITGFYDAEEEDGEQRGFVEVVDELIENKKDVPFRFIIIDTITALERYAIADAIRLANRDDKPKVRYTDISDIPWGKGYTMVADLVYDQIARLKASGFGIFVVGHTKTKKITNQDGFEYDYTMFNVLGKTSDIIEREADMIIYGDMQVVEGKDDEVITNRKLRFRSDGNILCGTRFRDFPEELESDAKVFLEAFNNTILGLYDNDEKALKKAEKEQTKSKDKSALAIAEKKKNTKDPADLQAEITELIKGLDKDTRVIVGKEFKEILGYADFRKSEDVKALEKALDYVKNL